MDKYIKIPIINKNELNRIYFRRENVITYGYINYEQYSLVPISEKYSLDILKWGLVKTVDLENSIFNCIFDVFNNNNQYHKQTNDYIICTDINIYNNEENIEHWLYIKFSIYDNNIDLNDYIDGVFNFLYINCDTICCLGFDIIILYENDIKQKIIIDNNDTNIFIKCNQDIRNINKVYFKLKQLPDLQCHDLCVNCIKNGNNELNFNIIDISVFEYEPEYADYYE